MALIVEDGTAKANADSYISVVDATAYHAARGGGDAWDAVEDQEAALRKATEYMMQEYRASWAGFRLTMTQRLDWPRAYVPIPDLTQGYGSGMAYLAQNVVPEEVRNACAVLALQSASGDLAPNLERAQSKVKVDVLEITYEPSSPEYKRYRAVDMMLETWLGGGANGGMRKLVRA